MYSIKIGDIMKQRRMELGLTQAELCEGIYEPSAYSMIESGHTTPISTKLKALLSRLGLPGEKFYAMLSENEIAIEQLKAEIVDCNTRLLYKEGLEKLEQLAALTKENDKLTQQFILRSRALAGKEKNGEIEPYTAEEQLELLWKAIRLTIPKFDLDDIDRLYYSLDEMKVINQMGLVYSAMGQHRQAIDIYYLLIKYLRKRFHINESTVSMTILILYNYSYELCEGKRYEEAMELAHEGWQLCIKWSRSGYLGGLFWVIGESLYQTGEIDEAKKYFIRSFYAYESMKNSPDMEYIRGEIKKYFGIDI